MKTYFNQVFYKNYIQQIEVLNNFQCIFFLYSQQICTCTGTYDIKTVATLKKYCALDRDEVLTDDEIQENYDNFNAIKGIGAQALADFKGITKRQCIVYYPFLEIVSKFFLSYIFVTYHN